MQKEVLEKIHEEYQGISKCRERDRQTVWWPQISREIKDCVSKCSFCLEKQPSQPLLPSKLPDRPFQRIAVDICEFKNSNFLISVDMYSRYLEIAHLSRMTSSIVIAKMKNLFARQSPNQSYLTTGHSSHRPNFVSSPWSGIFTTLRGFSFISYFF